MEGLCDYMKKSLFLHMAFKFSLVQMENGKLLTFPSELVILSLVPFCSFTDLTRLRHPLLT